MESNHHGLFREVTRRVENAPPSGLVRHHAVLQRAPRRGPTGQPLNCPACQLCLVYLTQQGGRLGALGFAMLSQSAPDVPLWDPCIKCPHASLPGRGRD